MYIHLSLNVVYYSYHSMVPTQSDFYCQRHPKLLFHDAMFALWQGRDVIRDAT
jgi:hypothetical protein